MKNYSFEFHSTFSSPHHSSNAFGSGCLAYGKRYLYPYILLTASLFGGAGERDMLSESTPFDRIPLTLALPLRLRRTVICHLSFII